MSNHGLASLSIAHVHYNPHDRLSYACAYLALAPQILCVVYATLIWSTREAEIAAMFAGQLACQAVNSALKRLIREERPELMRGKGYGMPSSHAQFVTFFATAVSLFLLRRHGRRQPHRATTTNTTIAAAIDPLPPLSRPLRLALSALSLAAAAAVAASRVYLGYHTARQVQVGAGAGASAALVWFAATAWLRASGWWASALSWRVVRWWRIRDLLVDEDLVEVGWRRWVVLEAEAEAAGGDEKRKKVAVEKEEDAEEVRKRR